MTLQIKVLAGAITLALAGHASAVTTWTLTTGTVSGNNSPVTATSTGWANTGSGGTANTQTLEQQFATGSSATTNFWLYSGGLGINNKDGCTSGTTCDATDVWSTAPEHAIDNQQRYEMVLASFNNDVKVTGVSFGWKGTDSDYTILAYTGAPITQTALKTQLGTQTWGGLTGWTAIGNYANAPISTTLPTGASVFSSYWLIGAYNPLANPGTFNATSYDFVKLSTVIGEVKRTTITQVPEPGSLALIGLALVGILSTRQRRRT